MGDFFPFNVVGFEHLCIALTDSVWTRPGPYEFRLGPVWLDVFCIFSSIIFGSNFVVNVVFTFVKIEFFRCIELGIE